MLNVARIQEVYERIEPGKTMPELPPIAQYRRSAANHATVIPANCALGITNFLVEHGIDYKATSDVSHFGIDREYAYDKLEDYDKLGFVGMAPHAIFSPFDQETMERMVCDVCLSDWYVVTHAIEPHELEPDSSIRMWLYIEEKVREHCINKDVDRSMLHRREMNRQHNPDLTLKEFMRMRPDLFED